MTMEFDTSYKKVPEKLIQSVRGEMLKLSHINKDILRAGIFLIEDKTEQGKDDKVCEIRLSVDNDNDLFVHARSQDFKKSTKEAIRDLKWMLEQQSKEHEEFPDELITTVNI